MKLFDCTCGWRFIVGKKHVYDPIYALNLPGHFDGPEGCHSPGRMMTREQFEDWYADCAYRFEKGVGPPAPHVERHHFCYEPHFDRHDHGLPNTKYEPHIHAPTVDGRGHPVKIIWEGESSPRG